MVDEHAEQHLELDELNKLKIENNHYDIVQNRIMIVGFFILLFVLNVTGIIVMKHSIHDCSEETAKHIMGDAYTPVHREMFEETK